MKVGVSFIEANDRSPAGGVGWGVNRWQELSVRQLLGRRLQPKNGQARRDGQNPPTSDWFIHGRLHHVVSSWPPNVFACAAHVIVAPRLRSREAGARAFL
jgi:hypothetical protein